MAFATLSGNGDYDSGEIVGVIEGHEDDRDDDCDDVKWASVLVLVVSTCYKKWFFYINQNIETKLYPKEKRANRKVASVFVPVVIDDCDDDESVEW